MAYVKEYYGWRAWFLKNEVEFAVLGVFVVCIAIGAFLLTYVI